MEKMRQTVEQIIGEEPFKDQNLKLIGMGADKIVFETPGSTKKIIKISTNFLSQKIGLLLNEGNETKIDSKTEIDADKYQKDLITEHKNIERDILEIFGSEHLLRSGVFKAEVPITKDMISKLMSNEHYRPMLEKLDDETVYKIKTLAETQIIAEELRNKEKFQTKSFNTDLVTEDNFRSAGNVPKALLYIKDFLDSNFLSEFDENSKDEKYVEIVKEIVTKIIKYTKRTGFMLDIFGPDNITIFNKEDDSLGYHLPDVILPGSQNYWRKNIKDDKNFNLLRHNYTFYYSIKSLADKLGIKDNLEPEDLNYFKGAGIPTEGEFTIKNE